MQIVSKICGHSSTKITEQVYAKLLDETIVDTIKKKYKNKVYKIVRLIYHYNVLLLVL